MAHEVLHILGTAQPEGTGMARIVGTLARGLDPERFRFHAWFLAGEGPLVGMLEQAGVRASALHGFEARAIPPEPGDFGVACEPRSSRSSTSILGEGPCGGSFGPARGRKSLCTSTAAFLNHVDWAW